MVRASVRDTWPFVTELDRMAMWRSPFSELSVQEEGVHDLLPGTLFHLAIVAPGRPTLSGQVIAPSEGAAGKQEPPPGGGQALHFQFKGPLQGEGVWCVVPAEGGVIVHHRVEYELGDARWLVPWALAGRWATILNMNWEMRRLKARVEDTVGSSSFGVPLLVSRYAIAAGAAALAFLAGVLALLVRRKVRPGR